MLASRFLRWPKLQSLTMSWTTPASSSAPEKGSPTNRASVLTCSAGSRSSYSYRKKSTLSGLAVLALQ